MEETNIKFLVNKHLCNSLYICQIFFCLLPCLLNLFNYIPWANILHWLKENDLSKSYFELVLSVGVIQLLGRKDVVWINQVSPRVILSFSLILKSRLQKETERREGGETFLLSKVLLMQTYDITWPGIMIGFCYPCEWVKKHLDISWACLCMWLWGHFWGKLGEKRSRVG